MGCKAAIGGPSGVDEAPECCLGNAGGSDKVLGCSVTCFEMMRC